MSSNHAAEVVLVVLGTSGVVIVGGILYVWRWTRRREARARTAEVVISAIAGPLVNRRSVAFALPTLLFALAMAWAR